MQRNFGLDLLRCFAIIGVMANHLTGSIPVHDFGAVVPVDLFFSLSGFLIAQMMVERFDRIRSRAAFWAFMANRWLRTIPLYLLALCAYLAVLVAVAPEPVNVTSIFARYAVFIQYIPWHHDREAGALFFLVSWSLAIEEWFYLLCPLVLLLIGVRSRRVFLAFSAGLVATSIACRLAGYLADPPLDLGMVLTSTPTRADAFIYGIVAYFAVSHGVRYRGAIALAGLALAAVNFAVLRLAPTSLYCYAFMMSAAPLSMALLIPASLSWRAPGLVRAAAAWLSTRTYAIYLFHTLVIAFTFPPGHQTAFRLLTCFAAVGLLADFLYRYVERPFMRMRPMRAPVPAPAQ